MKCEGARTDPIYEANSGLIAGQITAQDGFLKTTTASTYDALNRLTSISTGTGAATTGVSSHAYTYNDLNQRTESVLENGVQWDYGYDAMGQVISGQKKDAAGQPVPGTQFGYAYDGIGNRTSATVNGRTGTYTADAANQYTQRQVPGAVDIRGSASPAAKVTVNGQKVQRWGDYFYKGLAVDNSAAPQYPGVSVLAVRQAAGPNGEDVKSETAGNLFLAKTPEIFTHDLEGNLSADGRWNYTWDGENRLIRMETLAAVPAAAKRKLDFAYDAHSRRIRKQVSSWNGSAWVLQSDRRYLYDGWNLVAELDAANAMLRNYTWGLDLSRSPQGAGGVGGLLAIHEAGESYLPAYDGNGNVMALVKSSDQSIAARYEYGPFGETLVAQESGISNPFRFSTKFQDGESGLYYYGYRYYDPVTGRWPSRDPIEEEGGVNLYGFIRNRFTGWDYLGLTDYPCKCDDDLGRFKNLKFSLVTRTGTGSTYEATDPASTIFNYVSEQAESDAKNLDRRSDDQKENDTIKDIIEQKEERKSTLKQEIERGINAAKDAVDKGREAVDKGG